MRFFKKFLIISIIFFISFGLYLKLIILDKLPNIDKIENYQPIVQTNFYDRNDKLLYRYGIEDRILYSINKIPKNLINAFIATEDKTFYQNSGIDVIGILRAAVQVFEKSAKGEKIGGASTITQQLIKNVLLTNERTLTRKFKEVILSYKITKALPKDKILEIYLNHIYLGAKSYGVGSAAKNYFNKKLEELTLSECALIAGLAKSPSGINPFKKINKAEKRKNFVLERMLEEGLIDKEDYKKAISEKIKLVYQKDPYIAKLTSWFAKSNVESIFNITEDDLLKKGYNIYTTINADLQRISQDIFDKHILRIDKLLGYRGVYKKNDNFNLNHWDDFLNIDIQNEIGRLKFAIVLEIEDNFIKIGLKKDKKIAFIYKKDLIWALNSILKEKDKKINNLFNIGDIILVEDSEKEDEFLLSQIPEINGSVVALNENGEIISMVGGYLDIPGNLNRAVYAKRQAGSAIKPFIGLTALDNGIKPNDRFMDSYIQFTLPDGTIWSPQNHDKKYHGLMTFRRAIEFSRNTVMIRIAEMIGFDKMFQKVKELELSNNIDYNASVTIGSVETTLLNMVRSYSLFINHGKMQDIALVRKIENTFDKNKSYQDKIYLLNSNMTPHIKYDEKFLSNINNISEIEQINYENENRNNIFTPQSTFQMLSILKGNVERGLLANSFNKLNLNIAGKTGTSNDGIDLWFFGIHPSLIIGVYIGYDKPKKTNFYGSSVALPIYRDIMMEWKKNLKNMSFKEPKGIKFIKINPKTGLLSDSVGSIEEVFKVEDFLEKESAVKDNTTELEFDFD